VIQTSASTCRYVLVSMCLLKSKVEIQGTLIDQDFYFVPDDRMLLRLLMRIVVHPTEGWAL
jgi:hypothetical protein